jgi:RES domain
MMAEHPALYRVGRAPDPFNAWTPGEPKNHNNRFDDPRGDFGVWYMAEARRAAFLETLARFRPDLKVLAALADLPDGEFGDDTPQEAGVIPNDWHLKRRIGVCRVREGQRWADLTDLTIREGVRKALAQTFVEMGLDDFDMSDALSRRRDITQAIARDAYDKGYNGVIYASRLDPQYRCWAIFERGTFDVLEVSTIARDDADLLAVAATFDLRLAE